jgi:hypothetical protein
MYKNPVVLDLLLASHDILPAILPVELHHEALMMPVLLHWRPILIHMHRGVLVPQLLKVKLRCLPLV